MASAYHPPEDVQMQSPSSRAQVQVDHVPAPYSARNDGVADGEGVMSSMARSLLTCCSFVISAFLPCVWCSNTVIVREYEKVVVFRLGRVQGAKGPGLIYMLPCVDDWRRIDLRMQTLNIARQQALTKDSVSVTIDAVVNLKVIDAQKVVISVQDHIQAVINLAQTSMRSVIGEAELDELLSKREQINKRLRIILDTETEHWGVCVIGVELRDVGVPDSLQRAMAAQAEAERERRAKLISAQGEVQTAQQLAEAAGLMMASPAALSLRYWQTLSAIADSGKSTVILLPAQPSFSDSATSMAINSALNANR